MDIRDTAIKYVFDHHVLHQSDQVQSIVIMWKTI